MKDIKEVAQTAYRDFCEFGIGADTLSKAWQHYCDVTKQEIQVGDVTDSLVLAAIEHGVQAERTRREDSNQPNDVLLEAIKRIISGEVEYTSRAYADGKARSLEGHVVEILQGNKPENFASIGSNHHHSEWYNDACKTLDLVCPEAECTRFFMTKSRIYLGLDRKDMDNLEKFLEVSDSRKEEL